MTTYGLLNILLIVVVMLSMWEENSLKCNQAVSHPTYKCLNQALQMRKWQLLGWKKTALGHNQPQWAPALQSGLGRVGRMGGGWCGRRCPQGIAAAVFMSQAEAGRRFPCYRTKINKSGTHLGGQYFSLARAFLLELVQGIY